MLKGKTIVLASCGGAMDGLLRAVAQVSKVTAANDWMACLSAPSGSLLTLKCGLDRGFAVGDIHVVTPNDVLGEDIEEVDTSTFLREPQIRPGDVVLHEDHGFGILKALETVQVDGIGQDAARLDYRDGTSILVPMAEFGRLWRYGSSPDTVSLDRLYTEAWAKRRAAPELSVRVAHGKIKAAEMDEVMVGFGDGDGDVFCPPTSLKAALMCRAPTRSSSGGPIDLASRSCTNCAAGWAAAGHRVLPCFSQTTISRKTPEPACRPWRPTTV